MRVMIGPKIAPAGLPVADEMTRPANCCSTAKITAPSKAPFRPDFTGTFVRGMYMFTHSITRKLARTLTKKPTIQTTAREPGKSPMPRRSMAVDVQLDTPMAVTAAATTNSRISTIRPSKSASFFMAKLPPSFASTFHIADTPTRRWFIQFRPDHRVVSKPTPATAPRCSMAWSITWFTMSPRSPSRDWVIWS